MDNLEQKSDSASNISTPLPSQNPPTPDNQKSHKTFYIIVYIFILIALTAGTIIYGIKTKSTTPPITQKETNSTITSSPVPSIATDNWVKEDQCQGLIFIHPEDMHFFGTPSYGCQISTVNGNIDLYIHDTEWQPPDEISITESRNAQINGINGKRIFTTNKKGIPAYLIYEYQKGNLYYILRADLTNLDYSLGGNLDIYKDNPAIAEMVGVKNASTSASLEEMIQLIDQIAQSITFVSAQISSTPQFCTKEGETGTGYNAKCCSGLKSVAQDLKVKTPTEPCPPETGVSFVCIKCGNGICGKGEDRCTCPEDCSK